MKSCFIIFYIIIYHMIKKYILWCISVIVLSALGWVALADMRDKNNVMVVEKEWKTPMSIGCMWLPKRWWRNNKCNSIVIDKDFSLQEKTVAWRMKELLRIAHPDYKESKVQEIYEAFRASARLTWVRKEVWYCIAYADTWLWISMTTPHNWWNVWNNDRWDRQWYESDEDGILAIYKTVQNRNLWRARNIKELSMYARGTWYEGKMFYASWQHRFGNVMNCLKLLTKNTSLDDYSIYRKEGI